MNDASSQLVQLVQLVGDIDRFIRDSAASVARVPGEANGDRAHENRFGDLAYRAFALQYERVEPFRRLCDARGVEPGEQGWDWRSVPAVPTAAFRTLALHVAEPREIFRSSGTTGGPGSRSVHRHPFPDLFRTLIDATFPAACLPPPVALRPILSLVPSRRQVPDSSLGFLCDHILRRHGSEGGPDSLGSCVAFGDTGVDIEVALSVLRAETERPLTVLTTAFALAQLLDALAEHGPVRLAAGSTLMETGGFKGRRQQVSRRRLLHRVEALLGVSADHVVREYGMTELTSHVYTGVLRGGDPDVFEVPPWMRVRLLDPETLAEVPAGEPGLVAVFDLANVGSVVHVVSEDLGVADEPSRAAAQPLGGFRLLGRAFGADLRGCSLTVEELSG